MTKEEAREVIEHIPIGAKIQVIQKSGIIHEARLSSHQVDEISEKEYDTITVPRLPPAILVNGHIRQGNYRLELENVINIAWIDD